MGLERDGKESGTVVSPPPKRRCPGTVGGQVRFYESGGGGEGGGGVGVGTRRSTSPDPLHGPTLVSSQVSVPLQGRRSVGVPRATQDRWGVSVRREEDSRTTRARKSPPRDRGRLRPGSEDWGVCGWSRWGSVGLHTLASRTSHSGG